VDKNADHKEPDEILSFYNSKDSLYIFLLKKRKIYLPPENVVTFGFLKQLVKGEKEFFYQTELKRKTFKVRQPPSELLDIVHQDETLQKYFPEKGTSRGLTREFIMNVVNTANPKLADDIVSSSYTNIPANELPFPAKEVEAKKFADGRKLV